MQKLSSRSLAAAIVCLLLHAATSPKAEAATWRRGEIEGGSVRHLTRDPVSGRLYAGGGQGLVFASDDGGASWRRTNAEPFNHSGVLALEATAGALFAVDQQGLRLVRSTDGGITWRELDVEVGICGGRCGLVRDLGDPSRLYLLDSRHGIRRSDDRGATWTSMMEGFRPLLVGAVVGMAQSPVQPQLLYAVSQVGSVVRSTDSGETWTRVNAAPRLPIQIVAHPSDADMVFLLTIDGVERSADRGESWQPLDLGEPRGFPDRLGFSPDGALLVGLLDGIGFLRSVDDGHTFDPVPLANNPVDVSDFLAVDGSSRLLAATPSGILASADDGRTWAPANAGLSGVQAEDLFVAGGGGSRLFLIHHGGFARSEDGGSSWAPIELGEPGDEPLAVAVSPRSATVYAAFHQAAGTVLAVSSDGGTTWTLRPPFLPGTWLSGLAVDRLDDRRLVAGFVDLGLYASSDGGTSWQRIFDPTGGQGFASNWPHDVVVVGERIVASYVDFANRIDAIIVHSEDGGATWNEVFRERRDLLLDLAIDPSDPQLLYFTTGPEVHRSLDGGLTWRPLAGLPPGTVRDVATDSARGDVVLLTIPSSGIARSEDRGVTWEVLPAAPGAERFARVASAADRTVHAATLTGLYTLVPSEEGCDGPHRLCLNGGRFIVDVAWKDFQGGGGSGVARPLTSDTGTFWFFDPENIELVVKVLDARAVNGHFWVFYGSLTNVEFRLRVTDRETGEVAEYSNPPGQLASLGDTAAFPAAGEAAASGTGARAGHFRGDGGSRRKVAAVSGCARDATSLCLAGDRFRVRVDWRDFQGGTGAGQAAPIPDSSDTGSFWFFDPANIELVVKVLDARTVNGHFWVFYGALSNVGYTLTVTDTESGESVVYENPAGTFASRGDTAAFPG